MTFSNKQKVDANQANEFIATVTYSKEGNPLARKKIIIEAKGQDGVTVFKEEGETSEKGKAEFMLSFDKPGTYSIVAKARITGLL